MTEIDSRLKEMGIVLPAAPAPAASYVPFVTSGSLVYVSGQVTVTPEGVKHVGKIGLNLTLEDGKAAARICALNILAQAKAACGGDLSRVRRVVKVTVYVNATDDFTQHPEVANGASDLFVAILGEAGRHARAAVGVSSLPRGVATEVDAVLEIS